MRSLFNSPITASTLLPSLFFRADATHLRLHTMYHSAARIFHLTRSHKYDPCRKNYSEMFYSLDVPSLKPLSSWGTLLPYFPGANYSLRNVFSTHLSPHFRLLLKLGSFKWNYQVRACNCFQGSWYSLPNCLPERSCNLYSSLTSPL